MSEEEVSPDDADEDEDEDEDDWFERAVREDDDPGTADGDPAEDSPETDVPDAGVPDSGVPEAGVPDLGTEAPGGGDDDGGQGDPAPGDDVFGESFESPGGVRTDRDAFTEDFATAFQNAPAPGGSGGPPPDDSGFEDEEFESAIPRIDVGVEGLDEMIQGGIPDRALMVSIGNAGTGKTTFGLQFIRHALEGGENAVFITLEEEHDAIVSTADDKGWEFSEHVDEGRLAVVDLDPIQMANSLTSIRNELPDLVREFGASRLVLDSVSLLEMMYDDQAARRTQIYDFTRSLKRAGVTTMLTSEASEEDPTHSRFGIIEYLTDAVFVLQYVRPDDFRETRLAVEIQKIRNANHSREMKPYEITGDGINVYRQANIF